MLTLLPLSILWTASLGQAPFEFRVIPLRTGRYSDNGAYRLEVLRVKTGNVVFAKTYKFISSPTFDPSRRRLAFAVDPWVVVWSADQPNMQFRIPHLPNGSEGVYAKGGLLWSPDSRRLLVWSPETQGAMTLRQGALQLVDLNTRRFRYIASVGKPRWVSPREVEYSVFEYDEREIGYYGVYRLDILTPGAKPRFLRWEFTDWDIPGK